MKRATGRRSTSGRGQKTNHKGPLAKTSRHPSYKRGRQSTTRRGLLHSRESSFTRDKKNPNGSQEKRKCLAHQEQILRLQGKSLASNGKSFPS